MLPFDLLDDQEEQRAELAGMAPPADVAVDPALPPVPPPPSTPAPAGTGYNDAEALAAAEDQRAKADQTGMLLDAAASFARAGGANPGDLGATARATRDEGFKDVARRRALADQDANKAKAGRTAALEAALAKGDSPESVALKDKFSATTVGKALRERMGEDAWARLPGNTIPGAKEQLTADVDLIKSDRAAEIAAERAKQADEHFAKRLEAQKAMAALSQAGQNERFEKGLEYKQSKDVADDVSEIGKQVTDTVASVKTGLGEVLPLIAAAKKKYGEIPGTGLMQDFIGKSRLAAAYLNSPEEKKIRGLVESLNILNRTDITGAAFGAKEANDLRAAYADLLNADNLEQSLQRLLTKVDSAVKKHVQTKRPEAQAEFYKRFPELTPGAPTATPDAKPRKFYNAKLNKTKLVYPDGREEIVDGQR